MTKLYGVIDTSSKTIYGYKKKVPYKRFIPLKYVPYDIIVPTRIKLVPHTTYARIIIDESEAVNNLVKGQVDKIYGQVGLFDNEVTFIKDYNNIQNKGIDYSNINVNILESPIINEDEYIFTIDPVGCADRDDAISINVDNDRYILHIYISDVASIIKEESDLDKILATRLSSIYEPNKVIHMLPMDILDRLSLNCDGIKKSTICLEVVYNMKFDILEYSFSRRIVKISANYSYDEVYNVPNLKQDLRVLSLISSQDDSHKIIEYFMKMFSIYAGNYMVSEGYNCILRVREELQLAEYIYHSDNDKRLIHIDVGTQYYVHITSPMRRYIDICNMRILTDRIFNNTMNKSQINVKLDTTMINKYMLNIKRCHNDFRKLSICYDISKNYNNTLIDDAIIANIIGSRVENGVVGDIFSKGCIVVVDLVKLNTRIRFKLFHKNVAKSIMYTPINNGININGIDLKIGDNIKVKIISCILKPFISNKLLVKIINPDILLL